jgi:hypothetical protein
VEHSLVGSDLHNFGVANGEPLERFGHLQVELRGGFVTANQRQLRAIHGSERSHVLIMERERGGPITRSKGGPNNPPTRSTFSCEIAYSGRPAASRARCSSR